MPFFWITSCLIGGILLSDQVLLSPGLGWMTVMMAASSAFLYFLRKKRKNIPHYLYFLVDRLPNTRLPFYLLPVFILAGIWINQLHQPDVSDSIYSQHQSGSTLTIHGTVIEPADRREKNILVKVRADEFRLSSGVIYSTHENVLLFLPTRILLEYGDQITFRGKPVTPAEFEDFSYKDYLAGQKIFSLMYYPQVLDIQPAGKWGFWGMLYQFKGKSMDLLARLYPMPESGLVQGILLGDDSNIPDEVYDTFRKSGTTHLIAISGFNVAIVSSLIVLLFGRMLGKWRGAVVSIITIIIYTLLVGASPSVVRAAIMGSLSMFGVLLRRKNGGMNAAYFSAACMLCLNPFLLKSISFQLSFAATLGLVLFANPLHELAQRWCVKVFPVGWSEKIASVVSEYVLYTLAAQLLTFPLLLYHFHNLPLVTFVVNPLILPFQPPLMIASGLALLIAWVSFPLGQVLAFLSLPFSLATIQLADWAASTGIGQIQSFHISLAVAAGWIFLFSFFYAIPQLLKKVLTKISFKLTFILVGLVGLNFLLLNTYLHLPDGKLHVQLQGGKDPGVLLIQSPGGKHILLTTESSSNRVLAFTDPLLPVMNRSLDGILLYGDHQDDEFLTDLLNLLPADTVFIHPSVNQTDSILTKSTTLEAGTTLVIDPDLLLQIEENGISLRYRELNWRFVLTEPDKSPYCQEIVLFSEVPLYEQSSCMPQITISRSEQNASDIYLAEMKRLEIISDGQQLWMEQYESD